MRRTSAQRGRKPDPRTKHVCGWRSLPCPTRPQAARVERRRSASLHRSRRRARGRSLQASQ